MAGLVQQRDSSTCCGCEVDDALVVEEKQGECETSEQLLKEESSVRARRKPLVKRKMAMA